MSTKDVVGVWTEDTPKEEQSLYIRLFTPEQLIDQEQDEDRKSRMLNTKHKIVGYVAIVDSTGTHVENGFIATFIKEEFGIRLQLDKYTAPSANIMRNFQKDARILINEDLE